MNSSRLAFQVVGIPALDDIFGRRWYTGVHRLRIGLTSSTANTTSRRRACARLRPDCVAEGRPILAVQSSGNATAVTDPDVCALCRGDNASTRNRRTSLPRAAAARTLTPACTTHALTRAQLASRSSGRLVYVL